VYTKLGLEPEPVAMRPRSASSAPPIEGDPRGRARYEDLSGSRKLVARRMTEVKSSVPEFQVQTEVRMDEVIALRARIKEHLGQEAVVPSLNDMIVKACAIALRRHPEVNSSWADGRVAIFPEVNIGIAVAADTGLAVPVVTQADSKSLVTIAADTRRLAENVRTRKVSPEELAGGTFTVSNLGMFGMTAITPIINPPQAAILGVGSIREVLTREDGGLADRSLITLTLTCDHRVLDGVEAAHFLSFVRETLEQPLGLLL
jgi:pyruvate dehydrogenase E2 component (dihydrolipoamide acetyltransferase)